VRILSGATAAAQLTRPFDTGDLSQWLPTTVAATGDQDGDGRKIATHVLPDPGVAALIALPDLDTDGREDFAAGLNVSVDGSRSRVEVRSSTSGALLQEYLEADPHGQPVRNRARLRQAAVGRAPTGGRGTRFGRVEAGRRRRRRS
jgi:hypothetical protein